MRIHYIRHSMTVVNESGRLSGGLIDSPLSEKGKDIIRGYIKEGIYPAYPGNCYCSSLCRTEETLRMIYPEAHIVKTTLLDERFFGSIEYKTAEERKEIDKTINTREIWIRPDFRLLGDGESPRMFKYRVKRDFTKLLDYFFENQFDLVTIAGHGGYLKGIYMAFGIENMPAPYECILSNAMGAVLDVQKTEEGYRFRLEDCFGDYDIKKGFNVRDKNEPALLDMLEKYGVPDYSEY